MDNKKIEELIGSILYKIDKIERDGIDPNISIKIVTIETNLQRVLDHQQDEKNDRRRIYSKFDEVYEFVGDKVDKLELRARANEENLSKTMQNLYFSVAGGAILFGLNLLFQLLKVVKP